MGRPDWIPEELWDQLIRIFGEETVQRVVRQTEAANEGPEVSIEEAMDYLLPPDEYHEPSEEYDLIWQAYTETKKFTEVLYDVVHRIIHIYNEDLHENGTDGEKRFALGSSVVYSMFLECCENMKVVVKGLNALAYACRPDIHGDFSGFASIYNKTIAVGENTMRDMAESNSRMVQAREALRVRKADEAEGLDNLEVIEQYLKDNNLQ